jgi:hypothetical protein
LNKEEHYQLIAWAVDCAEHVMHLYGEPVDKRLKDALRVAGEWRSGDASVGDAMRAAVAAHAAAREASDPAAIAVARSAGHAVATAHMADHSLGAAWYALKAVKNAGTSVDAERRWQDEQLPSGIRDLILTARKSREM